MSSCDCVQSIPIIPVALEKLLADALAGLNAHRQRVEKRVVQKEMLERNAPRGRFLWWFKKLPPQQTYEEVRASLEKDYKTMKVVNWYDKQFHPWDDVVVHKAGVRHRIEKLERAVRYAKNMNLPSIQLDLETLEILDSWAE